MTNPTDKAAIKTPVRYDSLDMYIYDANNHHIACFDEYPDDVAEQRANQFATAINEHEALTAAIRSLQEQNEKLTACVDRAIYAVRCAQGPFRTLDEITFHLNKVESELNQMAQTLKDIGEVKEIGNG